MQNCNSSEHDAQQQVMREHPHVFQGVEAVWNPALMCDGHAAASRAKWVIDNCGASEQEAQQRVMQEFPKHFSGLHKAEMTELVHALGGASSSADVLVPAAPSDPNCLVWSDDFDYVGRPDAAKWRYDTGGHGWGNHEQQNYTDRAENAWVEDGCLKIKALREDFAGNRFTSARLVSKSSWLYGRMEARVRVPNARGSWAAAWMLPTQKDFGEWPRSGEIDIMEHVGMDCGRVHGTVHTERFNHMRGTQVGRCISVASDEWHTFAVDWSEHGIAFIVDGNQYHHFARAASSSWEMWPFDRPFHIILNLAVGGDWGGQKGVDEDAFRNEGQVMEVAWVRVFKSSQGNSQSGG
ncbi:unnamed protein product [Polarella glacialis]|uniref:GH16 domain-containing protein n=1 Tax=Polarella glacialis TaxID=89957 RepID=A0A813JWG3_POLGL|nr:unnamed protein product [Polarella glacialis]